MHPCQASSRLNRHDCSLAIVKSLYRRNRWLGHPTASVLSSYLPTPQISGDSVTLVEKSFEGNVNAGGDQQRDMKGTLTGSVLKLNALEFQRED